MKKLILISAIALFSLSAFADKRAEVTVIQSGLLVPVKTYLDDGEGKVQEIKNNSGKKFTSAVAAINSFVAKGWTITEMHVNTISFASVVRVYVLIKKEE